MVAIVVSREDRASVHVGEHLLDLIEWTEEHDDDHPTAKGGGAVYRTDGAELRTFDRIHLELELPSEPFDDPDLLVFASRHAGETGPLLTAHHTGNFGTAEFGGRDRTLARAAPAAHRRVVHSLGEYAPDGYDVGMECTHHGPSDVGVPSMFVEVGSGREEWEDPTGARAVARSILDLRGVDPDASPENGTRRHLVGFGGGHYAPRFERVLRETDWAVGHVAADWALDAMGDPADNRVVIERAFEESVAEYALVDGDRPDLLEVVEELGYHHVSETFLRETTSVSLDLVHRLEDALVPVAAGLRFGQPARNHDGTFEVLDLPTDLLTEARGIDADAVGNVLSATALAYCTEESGTKITGPAALPVAKDRERIIEGLADVLRESYDEVAIADDVVVARETAFDPGLARDRGVPEGPLFGRLADGRPVDVAGETVRPEEVHRERERRFRT